MTRKSYDESCSDAGPPLHACELSIHPGKRWPTENDNKP